MIGLLHVRNRMITRSALMLLMSVLEANAAQAGSWVNGPFAAQTGTFSVTFQVTPTTSRDDLVVGLSQSAASAYAQLAAIVRFNNSGVIDARNAGAYGAV